MRMTLALLVILSGNIAVTADEIVVDSVLLTIVDEADVPARDSGVLAEIHVREGEQVEVGQLLANLNDEEARLAVERAAIELERAVHVAGNDIKLRLAKKELELAKADLDRAMQAGERLSNSVSATELDRLRLDVQRATLQVEQSQFDAAAAKLVVRIQENELRSAEERLRRRQLVAPIRGTIVSVHRNLGEALEVGQAVVRVIDTRILRAEGFVKVDQIRRDLIGRPVQLSVRLPGLEKESFEGELAFVHPEVDPVTRQVRVWAHVENSGGKLRPGLSGSMTIRD